jgi:hypothetical protein
MYDSVTEKGLWLVGSEMWDAFYLWRLSLSTADVEERSS